jgi:ribosome-binding factor A
MKSHRLARVNEVVREVAATTILFEVKDPRVKNVTVTRAEVSADLQHAKVFVSVMGSEKEQQLTMHGLKSAAGYIQTKVAERLTSRYVPHVTFVRDEGVKKSIEIARLIREESEQAAADAAARAAAAGTDTETPPADAPAAPDTADQPDAADGPAGRAD